MHVLLTGGSGFIAAHVLDSLLAHKHTVVTTVRSQEKASAIHAAHPSVPETTLSCVIVPDIAVEHAFDKALRKPTRPFDAVIHTASPFRFDVTDFQRQLLDPAVIGTTGILRSIHAYAPSVKHVVITSSFAAIIDSKKGFAPGYTYSEADWNPISEAEAMQNASAGYRGSKTFAERAAWDFLEREKPNFTLTTMNPPLVLGPIVHHVQSLEHLNTSNQRIRNILRGDYREVIPETGTLIWVDVRDLAEGHVLALEKPAAQGKRFFITAGYFSNKEIVEIIRKNFPDLRDNLPLPETKGGRYPEGGLYKFDNTRTEQVLGLHWTTLEDSIVDTVKSLQAVGA